jgi:hypothetical protein
MNPIARRSIALLSLIFLTCSIASAQSGNATLQGTITDPTGAVVPNAHVHIVEAATGVARDIDTNSAGFYAAPNLPPGRYTVTITAPGFGTKAENDLLLTVGAVRDLDIPVAIATSDQTINVETSSNQVNTVDTSVQGIIDGKQTRDLPLNGRDWTTLATLNTGVSQILTQYAGAATATTRLSRGLGAQLTIGGNRPEQNAYRLDGVDINDYANGGPGSVSGVTLGVDAIQEFNVITADAPAQFGRMSGGVINSITRQGTNEFHGSVYDFLRNSVFDSRSYFDPLSGEPSFRRNQLGGTIGGPIVKNKTFFFFNYEGFRQAQGQSLSSTVLSPNAQMGDVTCTQAAAGKTQNAACRTGVGSATVAPAGSAGIQLLAINGTISGNTGTYNYLTTVQNNEDQSTLHLDHNFSEKDSLHGTLLYDTASLDSADTTNTLYDEAISRRTTAALEEVHVFSSRLSNAIRAGYNRSVAVAPDVKAVINPAVNNLALGFYTGRPVGEMAVSGLTTLQGGNGSVGTNAYHYNSYQISDDANYVIGKHSITFGGNIEQLQNNDYGGVLPNGEWSFGSINNFLTNVPTFFTGAVPLTPVIPHDLRQTIYAAYFQDSWKFRSNLTLNLGVRYEMVTDTTETRGRLGELPTVTSPASVPVNTFFTNNPTVKNFEPRIGLAWDPYHNGKTLFTAASGLYDILPLNYLLQVQVISSAPTYEEGEDSTTPAGSFPLSPFYTTVAPLLRSIYTPQTPPRSYVIQTNLNFQQQLTPNTILQIGYITSHGVHEIFTSNDINNVATLGKDPLGNYYWPDTTQVAGATREALVLNPKVGTESDSFFGGSSLYNSLQTSLSYAAPRGITGRVSYTWSHAIDDSSSAVSGATFSNSIAGLPTFDLTLDRADSDFDLRNVFSANAVAPIPNLKAGGMYTAFLRHWTFNNIFSIRSGIPFTPIISGDQLGLLGTSTYAFPNRNVYSRKCTNGHSTNYIDLTCFSFPTTYNPPGTTANDPQLGTSRRNTLQGPGLFFWTTGLMRDQPITERVRAQFQVQAFNASNHTNFSNPASTQTALYNVSGAALSTAGQLTSPTATSGRQLQFALKILF